MAICNCENIRHDLENTMPDLAPEIPRDGHALYSEQEGSHPHAYVGDVCTACHTSCFASFSTIPTYTVRTIWEGEQLLEVTGLDYEDASRRYEEEMGYYLNLPNSEDAAGTTLQMFRESDDHIEREVTFA